MKTLRTELVRAMARPIAHAAEVARPAPAPDLWQNVVDVLHRHYYEPDTQAARILYAAVAAHDLEGQPVWPMIVAPPGSMKTELIRALVDVPRVHSIDQLTSKTFISGQINDGRTSGPTRAASLLHRIGESGIVLCPDFSTILSIKADDRDAIFADMRRIFDGELRKEFGTSQEVPIWRGRMTFIVAVTQEIDRMRRVINRLGDRFLLIRMSRQGREAARIAMTQDIKAAHDDLKAAVNTLMSTLSVTAVTVSAGTLDQISALAEFTVRARTDVPREGNDHHVPDEPEAESAPRLAQQLCQLAKGNARLAHRNAVNEEDVAVVKRVAIDCLPPRRWDLLSGAINGERVKVRTSTIQYDRDDLIALELLAADGNLSELGTELVTAIGDLTKAPPRQGGEINQEPRGASREGQDGHARAGGASREGQQGGGNGIRRS